MLRGAEGFDGVPVRVQARHLRGRCVSDVRLQVRQVATDAADEGVDAAREAVEPRGELDVPRPDGIVQLRGLRAARREACFDSLAQRRQGTRRRVRLAAAGGGGERGWGSCNASCLLAQPISPFDLPNILAQAQRMMYEEGVTLRYAAGRLGVSHSLLSKWSRRPVLPL